MFLITRLVRRLLYIIFLIKFTNSYIILQMNLLLFLILILQVNFSIYIIFYSLIKMIIYYLWFLHVFRHNSIYILFNSSLLCLMSLYTHIHLYVCIDIYTYPYTYTNTSIFLSININYYNSKFTTKRSTNFIFISSCNDWELTQITKQSK